MTDRDCVRGDGSVDGVSSIEIPDPSSNAILRIEVHPNDERYPVYMCPDHVAEVVTLWALEQARMGEMNDSNYNRSTG